MRGHYGQSPRFDFCFARDQVPIGATRQAGDGAFFLLELVGGVSRWNSAWRTRDWVAKPVNSGTESVKP